MGGALPPADRQPRGAVAGPSCATIERMTIQRMEHVGIVVDDLAAATAFFVELGLKRQGEGAGRVGGGAGAGGGARGGGVWAAAGGRARWGRPRTPPAGPSWRSYAPPRAGAATGTRRRTPRASA